MLEINLSKDCQSDVVNSSGLNEFEELVSDFINICGYSQSEAELSAKNVLNEDNE